MKKLQSIGRKVATANLRVGAQAPTGPVQYGQGRGGRPWERLRRYILERDRYQCQCAECQAAPTPLMAEEVDHKVPKAEGGTDDPSNLQAMAKVCHKKKTAEEARRGMHRAMQGEVK